MTPLRVPVEIARGERRCWRLAEAIDVETIRLERAAPFDRGSTLDLRFALPGGPALATGGMLVSPTEIRLTPAPDARRAIQAYLGGASPPSNDG